MPFTAHLGDRSNVEGAKIKGRGKKEREKEKEGNN